MCTDTSNEIVGENKVGGVNSKIVISMMAFCGAVSVASLVTAIVLSGKVETSPAQIIVEPAPVVVNGGGVASDGNARQFTVNKPPEGESPCAGHGVSLDNVQCLVEALENVLPQAGGNVTVGYKGDLEVTHEPIKEPYWKTDLCPVNVHWHLGTEHLSVGEFDENGKGPTAKYGMRRALAAGEDVRGGFRCHHYDESDPKFTTPYNWQHCVNMQVGETYEVHWPHSAAGACGTVDQFQTPFYDGVLCNLDVLGDLSRIYQQIGVQGQVFTIVNDEDYFYPNLLTGMLVDGEMGKHITKYTGSTTGTSRNNEICSQYSPLTWQVDRKCHMISASSFDKLCADMKSQRDDMSEDLYPHGARELVDSQFVANNQHNRKLRGN